MNHLRNMLVPLTIVSLLSLGVQADQGADRQEIYGRLIAPCCWTQTFDIHDSEVATQLRVEIASRLGRGESSLSIEDDMARRFGERIRAVPRARDPRQSMALSVVSTLVLVLLALFSLARRWTRARVALHEGASEDGALGEEPRAEYDVLLDRELLRVESPARAGAAHDPSRPRHVA